MIWVDYLTISYASLGLLTLIRCTPRNNFVSHLDRSPAVAGERGEISDSDVSKYVEKTESIGVSSLLFVVRELSDGRIPS